MIPARHIALVLCLLGSAAAQAQSQTPPSSVPSSVPSWVQTSAAEGRAIAFDRGKGNCLTCHEIKGGDLPGTIGPPLNDMKARFPDRNELIGIVTDETKRNPLTVMPPFGRNLILNEKEISAVVEFLYTL